MNSQKWFSNKLKQFENDPEFIKEYKKCGKRSINWGVILLILFCMAEIGTAIYCIIKYLL